MMKISLKLILLTIVCMTAISSSYSQYPQTEYGKIIRIENFPSDYLKNRTIDIWLPENYSSDRKFAVLYMHDGQMLYDSTLTWNKQEWGVDETLHSLITDDKITEPLVVGIHNAGPMRLQEFLPLKAFHSLPGYIQDSIHQESLSRGGTKLYNGKTDSDRYLKFLVKEVKPFIDNTFNTLKSKENTFVAGSSLGGLVSIYALCEYPEIFGGAACLSTHWPGAPVGYTDEISAAFKEYLKQNLPSAGEHKIYFDYGTEALDAHYEPHQLDVDEIMKQKGYDSNSWMTQKYEGADHSENAWRKRLHIPLVFLLGKNQHD